MIVGPLGQKREEGKLEKADDTTCVSESMRWVRWAVIQLPVDDSLYGKETGNLCVWCTHQVNPLFYFQRMNILQEILLRGLDVSTHPPVNANAISKPNQKKFAV